MRMLTTRVSLPDPSESRKDISHPALGKHMLTQGTQEGILAEGNQLATILEESPPDTPKKSNRKRKVRASPCVQKVNDSIWKMDQKENYLRSYEMLESYATGAGLLYILGLMWHRMATPEECASVSTDGFSAWMKRVPTLHLSFQLIDFVPRSAEIEEMTKKKAEYKTLLNQLKVEEFVTTPLLWRHGLIVAFQSIDYVSYRGHSQTPKDFRDELARDLAKLVMEAAKEDHILEESWKL
uniref:Uncharacterized protein n=1 Tax=Cannabis sativa TaxID=3483 RepID=A0A803NNI1_CANSA